MARESGNISVQTENIFPIIKKWLYSDKDIFIRELVSNASDAISKFRKLVAMGEAQAGGDEKYEIKVILDRDMKMIKVVDNGIGMTAEEVRKYINQIAFSGAQDFLEKYKDKADEGNQIIGHFGLGFYSAFMVAEKVRIDTLSHQPGAEAVRWICDGSTEYVLDASDRTERGTTITLYIAEDGMEFLDQYKFREILMKYCAFLPTEIYLDVIETKEEKVEREKREAENRKKREEEKKKAEEKKKKAEEAAGKAEEAAKDEEAGEAEPYLDDVDDDLFVEGPSKPVLINDTHPLWLKNPRDCTDEEYKAFYHKVFSDFNDPLFWIHLNMEYPFNFKGILYFPKLKHEFETIEGQIKLFNNQVYVADNIKEIIPEFLMLLKGVLDCPDLPLNVSRSFLQNDGYVKKISNHIIKKVADKLTSLFENEREKYNQYWDDINPFVKYGCIREANFYDRVKDIVIYKTTRDDSITMKDYLERNKEKHKDKVFYVTNEEQQAQYVKLFKEHDMEAVILTSGIDTHFITLLESKDPTVRFNRIDADLADSMKDSDAGAAVPKEESEELEKLFRDVLGNSNLKVQVENLKEPTVSAMILLNEYGRRWQEMSAMYRGLDKGTIPDETTLLLNRKNKLIDTLLKLKDAEDRKEDVDLICHQVYDLAMMSHRQLEAEAMTRFIERSSKLLNRLAAGE